MPMNVQTLCLYIKTGVYTHKPLFLYADTKTEYFYLK